MQAKAHSICSKCREALAIPSTSTVMSDEWLHSLKQEVMRTTTPAPMERKKVPLSSHPVYSLGSQCTKGKMLVFARVYKIKTVVKVSIDKWLW